ncbi:MAG: TonB-dependent receptor plug domain-containing protein [Alphaproteobacteria bacterium]|nr:TonB-dependent receptor plug domain-containing protein [Alphaproteobacteria bacterium]
MKNRLLATASCAVATIALASPASAQTAVEALRDNIVVTATKKANAENVQDVPIAVTAFGDERLDALQFRDLQDLTYTIPNTQFDDIGTTPGTANFSVRGIGVNSSIPSIDPTVGVFVDGMYYGVNSGVLFNTFDIESIEVLRGPQGILFGRNVTGGAVVINTKDAPDEFEASFKFAADSGFRGSGLNYYTMGSVGGPIIRDVLNAKIAVYWNDDDGWQNRYTGDASAAAAANAVFGGIPTVAPAIPLITQNARTGEVVNHGKQETLIIRPSFLLKASDTFSLNVKFEYGQVDGDGASAQNHTNGLGQTNPFYSAPRDSFDFSIDEPGITDNDWMQVIAEANWDVPFGDGTITNIFSWRDYESFTRGDIDATPLFLFHSDAALDQRQLSNELRYAGRFFDALDATVGVFYFTQDVKYDEKRFLLGGARNQFGGGQQDHDVLGIFGNFDYEISDSLTFTFGGRWTREEKTADIANLFLNLATGSVPCEVTTGTCPFDFSDSESWTNFTPKVGLTWAANDFTNVYAHWTQGVRSGGYNFRNTSSSGLPTLPTPGGPVPNPAFDPLFLPGPFDEELVNAYEIGFKTQPGDGKATINAAIFVNDISNMQREINLADPTAGVVQTIVNSADATIWGIEIDTLVAVTDNLVFTGFLGFVDGKYQSVLFDIGSPNPNASPGVVDGADLLLEIPRLSPFSYGAGFVYSLPFGRDGSINARFNYAHRDANFYTDNNLGVLNEVDIIDAGVEVSPFGDGVTFRVYGKNLLNENNFGGDTQLPTSIGAGTFSPLTVGRRIGVELQLDF